MGNFFRFAAIVLATTIVVIVSLAIIGFSRGPRAAHAARTAPNAAPQPTPPTPPSSPAPLAQATPAPAPQSTPPTTTPTEPAPLDLTVCVEVHKLNTLEAQGKHADAALAIFEDSPSLIPTERDEVAAWLKARIKPGRIPAMYWLARLAFLNNDLPQAANWFAAAALSGRIDAARLTDQTAASAVPAIEAHFSDLKKALAADATLRRAASAWALDFEESTKDRAPAAWIAAHGLAFKGAAPATIPDDQWQTKRQQQRDAWKKLDAE